MRFLYAKFKGYIGFYNGLGLEELVIDFTKAKHNICVISGPNGVGKSTLANSLSILPDSNDCFVPNMNASKEITVQDENNIYQIEIHHILERNSRTTKAYISKNGEQLNENGSVTQYRDIIFSEFDIDGNYLSMAAISSENKGLADKRPGERKKIMASHIKTLETYNEIYKSLNKRANVFKSQLNALSAKIQNIGSKESLEMELAAVCRTESTIASNIEEHKVALTEAQTKIKMLDPDGSIEKNHETWSSNLSMIDNVLNKLVKDINQLYPGDVDYIDKKVIESVKVEVGSSLILTSEAIKASSKKLDERAVEQKMHQERITEITTKLDQIEHELNKLESSGTIAQIDTIRRALAEKKALVDGLLSENQNNPFIDKKDTISVDIIKAILKIIELLQQGYDNLKEQMSDDGVKFIEETVEKSDFSTAEELLIVKLNDVDASIKQNNYTASIDARIIASTDAELSTLKRYTEGDFIVHPKCKLTDSCNLYRQHKEGLERVETLTKEKEEATVRMEKADKEIKELKAVRVMLEKHQDLLTATKAISSFLISNSAVLTHLFSNELNLVTATPDFPTVCLKAAETILYSREALQDFHNFEVEYLKLQAEINVMESTLLKSSSEVNAYERCTRDKEELTTELESHKSAIANIVLDNKLDEEIVSKNTATSDKLNRISLILDELEETIEKRNDILKQLKKIKDDASTITDLSSKIMKSKSVIEEGMLKMEDIVATKSKISSQLLLLDNFMMEYASYKEKYDYTNTLRKYSSPTQGSIQTLYMSMYMNKTLDLTNQLLGMLFDGRYRLLDYIINEDEFRIPFVGDGLTVDDISSGSTSQKCIMGAIINLVLFSSSSSIYDIASMDEVDGGLDHVNRMLFVYVVQKMIEVLKISQLFLISHSIEASLSNIDVILLSDDKEYIDQFSNANIIYQYTRG